MTPGARISKSSLDRGRKQKRPLGHPANSWAWVIIKIFFLYLSFQTKQLRDRFHSAPEKGLKIFSHLPGGSIKQNFYLFKKLFQEKINLSNQLRPRANLYQLGRPILSYVSEKNTCTNSSFRDSSLI